MPIVYNIVPKDNGYMRLGLDHSNKHCLINKALPINRPLIFDSAERAQAYIDEHNLKDYKVEEGWRGIQLICPECGNHLFVISVDKATNETIYHCSNKECELDFSVLRDKDNHFIKMNRKFWG